MGINGILTVINVSSMIRPIQPYDLANATVLSGSFYAVENIVLRRGLFFSTAGKQFASPSHRAQHCPRLCSDPVWHFSHSPGLSAVHPIGNGAGIY